MSLRLETRAVHPPLPRVTGGRPLSLPLQQGHLFGFDGADELAAAFDGPDGAFFYGRFGNPTVRALEDAVADLEGGVAGLAFASGMGAVNGVLLSLLSSGDHVIAQRCLYGGTFAMLRNLAARWGVQVSYVSGNDPAEVRAALRPNTRLLYLETIANPTTQVVDLPALIGEVAPAGVLGVVDNTFASPLLCRPLEHGADVVIHATTKFLGGHGDVLGGVAVFELRRAAPAGLGLRHRAGRRGRPVRGLADPARDADAGAADGAALRQRARPRRAAGRAPGGVPGPLPGPAEPSRPRDRRAGC